jgi:hypothetical protein
MPSEFRELGISFQYPENWTLDDEDIVAGRQSVTVFSPTGAFWSISVHPRSTNPLALANEAVEAMKEEYVDPDVEEIRENVSGHDLVGYDMNFFAMDLTTTARIRCLRTRRATYAVFCQAEDDDLGRLGRVFEAITTSLLRSLDGLSSPDRPSQ